MKTKLKCFCQSNSTYCVFLSWHNTCLADYWFQPIHTPVNQQKLRWSGCFKPSYVNLPSSQSTRMHSKFPTASTKTHRWALNQVISAAEYSDLSSTYSTSWKSHLSGVRTRQNCNFQQDVAPPYHTNFVFDRFPGHGLETSLWMTRHVNL